MKRKCSAKQLRALAKGRRIRAANLRKKRRKGKGFGKRRNLKRRRSTTNLRKSPSRKKRVYRRSNSMSGLTGGSRDVNPQFLNVSITQHTHNENIKFNFAVPVVRTPGTGNKVTVMEILKIGFMFANPPPVIEVVGFHGVSTYASVNIGEQTTHQAFHHWSVLAAVNVSTHGAFTVGGTFTAHLTEPFWYDLTDGAGHGVLVATDTMTIMCDTYGYAETGPLQRAEAKILYRFKRIGMSEYIGIVQSQQGK